MHPAPQPNTDFISLIKSHERLIYKVCGMYAGQQEDIRDIFQEIVLQAWKSYPGFKHNAKPGTWLYRVALNTAINYKRAHSKIRTVGQPELLNEQGTCLPELDEEYKLMHRMISMLPSLEKAIVMLYLDDYSYKEMAEIMGMSETNIGTKLMRIKEKLKSQAREFINS